MKDEPTDEQLRTATDPTVLAGDERLQAPPPGVGSRATPEEGRLQVQNSTGWSCAWESTARKFVAAHPEHGWLKVEGSTPREVSQRIHWLGAQIRRGR